VRVDPQARLRLQHALCGFHVSCEVVRGVLQAPEVVVVGDGQRALAARERRIREQRDVVRRGVDAVDRERGSETLVAAQLDHARATVYADPCALCFLIDVHARLGCNQCFAPVRRGKRAR